MSIFTGFLETAHTVLIGCNNLKGRASELKLILILNLHIKAHSVEELYFEILKNCPDSYTNLFSQGTSGC